MANDQTDSGEFLYHSACNDCGSSDARAVYSSGSSFCFACSKWSKEEGADESVRTTRKGKPMGLLSYEYQGLNKRKVPETIAKQFRYGLGHDNSGVLCHVANYFNKDKEIVAQKLRYPDKTFKFIGDSKEALMFGQQLWGNSGK